MAELTIDERVWQITCNGEPVEHLFDAKAAETYDPTQAVEVVIRGTLNPIVENDVFTFTLLADGP